MTHQNTITRARAMLKMMPATVATLMQHTGLREEVVSRLLTVLCDANEAHVGGLEPTKTRPRRIFHAGPGESVKHMPREQRRQRARTEDLDDDDESGRPRVVVCRAEDVPRHKVPRMDPLTAAICGCRDLSMPA